MSKKVLITGGTEYLAMHVIHRLLQQNYQVRTTVYSLESADYVKKTMSANGITDLNKLTFVAADLLKDEGWDQVVKDQDYVVNIDTPIGSTIPLAVQGIQRMLTAASKAQVKRVVMTSSFGAIGSRNLDKNKVFTEEDWTDENQAGLSYYDKVSLMVEKSAWKFIENDRSGMELVTVNPVAILGPPLDGYQAGSFNVLRMVFIKGLGRMPVNLVDVRDVADVHIRAMLTPEARNQRFIAATDKITLLKIKNLIRKERPQLASELAEKPTPPWVMDIASNFLAHAKKGKLMMDLDHTISNQKAQEILGWQPMFTKEQTILDSIDGMVKDGVL